LDVTPAKARNSYYYASNDLQPQDQIAGIPKGTAFTTRTFRYLASPFYPSGNSGAPPGPFSILNEPGIDPTTGRARKFTYPPQLLVVDGGAPQVEAAQAALSELGMSDIAVVGLAKRLEEVWLPGDPDTVILPRTSEGLYRLQRIRDEAHRFAIAYQRQKRGKRMIESLLDDVPGLGDIRRKAVLKQFGSLKRLKAASVEEIASVPGIGPSIAQSIFDTLATHASAPSVNVTTGEIID
jgi:excinuclease ABC subunit C